MSVPTINFATLQPAIMCKETPTGTIETAHGFEPRFSAKVVIGADWLEFDPDKKHVRISGRVSIPTTDGKDISFGYQGIIALNEAVMKILTWSQILGDPALDELQNMTLVGNDRMLVNEETRVITVESRISPGVSATGTHYMMSNNKILFILGAGPNVATALQNTLRRKDIKSPSPDKIPEWFAQVKKKYGGAPNVVIHNAYHVFPAHPQNPLSLSLGQLNYDLAVNVTSAYLAAQEAVKGFETLPAELPK
ncbi:hypothetical protein N7470_008443 [Penicillium chermesinum]|nr:hypothetical protein N7470_008443 [Penicillium chermesinum]